ncbi:MAG: hypothetical protein HYR64_00745 [Fimbriimonas ginsengisoli]|uniref:Uncharacterized protein n=1 Tax=Fimbriimonas ginsengisoli TaxID=1005039 RepID=A0A931LQI3_FIMGI|nr:hypothetical protein [Fimbriimonas ginsengisoli]
MAYKVLAEIAQGTVLLFLVALAGTIAIQLLTRRINAKGLFLGRRRDGTAFFNPLKVQLLIATVAIAMEYVMAAAQNHTGGMPKLPDPALYVLGLSNAAYLGGKGWTLLRPLQQLGGN